MKVSLTWLNDFVDMSGIGVDELANRLTMAGLEIEGIKQLKKAEKVITAKIADVKKHPDADKLSLCKVDDGVSTYDVVCGADNVATGQIIPFAKVGAVLPNGLKIKKAKLRGVESFGMICSAAELGLEDKSEGIMPLPANTPVNADVNDILGLGDYVLDIGITPNRADCLSILGIAREISAVYSRELKTKSYDCVFSEDFKSSDLSYVKVLDEENCPIYLGRVIKNVTIKPSPLWLQNRLRSVGVRPINNIVDVTNYVLFEYGQPLHTFDLKKIDGGIVVRRARKGEEIQTLDGKDRKLDEDMLVIADETKPIAIAGIMGGQHSGISTGATDVFLECAYFKPENVRMTARKLGLQTDSSYRYERGVDRENTLNMVDYAASLLLKVAGGEASADVLSNPYKPFVPVVLDVNVGKINRFLGCEIEKKEMTGILKRLGFDADEANSEVTVTVPSYRVDISRWQDIAEEVARIFGYDNIEATIPKIPSDSKPPEKYLREVKNIKHSLKSFGFSEVINYSFMSDKFLSLFDNDDKFVKLLNPISEDMNTLRTFVFPGVISSAKQNLNQGFKNVKLFEIAKTFIQSNNSIPRQLSNLAICSTAGFFPKSWNITESADTFYHIKGVADNILSNCKADVRYEKTGNYPFLHPGKSAVVKINGKEYGFLGQIHPDILEKENFLESVYIAELFIEDIIRDLFPGSYSYRRFSVYPFVYKDLSVIVDKNIVAGDVLEYIKNFSELVYDVYIYDLYSGEKIGKNSISLTFRIFYSALDRTLTDEEANGILEKIISGLKKEFSAELR